jgi:Glycosyl hydrolases family 31
VLEEGARERTVYLPPGEWIDARSGETLTGGREVTAHAPVDRIPVWVRHGALVVTYPAERVAAGLGHEDESERPLEATLWGRPPAGRAQAKLADGTTVRWLPGRWSVSAPDRDVTFAVR